MCGAQGELYQVVFSVDYFFPVYHSYQVSIEHITRGFHYRMEKTVEKFFQNIF